MDKFYKSVEDIVLFPGTLDELNQQEKLNKSGKVYQLIPTKDSVRDIWGFILPEQEELSENIRILLNVSQGNYMGKKIDSNSELFQILLDKMNNFYEKIQEKDIRLKVKKIGADGLIHVTYQERADFLLEDETILHAPRGRGLPVKLMK